MGFDAKKEYIAIEVTPTKELLQYREELEKKMQEYGVPFKKQDFFSHISLGRVHHLEQIENKEYFKQRIIKPSGVHVYESIPESNSLISVKCKDYVDCMAEMC